MVFRRASGVVTLLLGGLGLFALAPAASAQGTGPFRVIEEEAIPFTAFLDKAAFDERFPGERVARRADLEPGYYVVYRHRRLNYFFGPMLLESTGKDYLSRLETIVAEAVAQRPSLRDHTLELRYEPDTPPEAAREGASDDSERNPPANRPPAERPRKRGMFDWLFRIFGL